MDEELNFDTLAVRAGIERSQFGENSEALFLNSSFRFKNAAQAAARFGGTEPGNIYSRFTNPTVTMLQNKLAALEGAEQCVATSSGMAAILACVMGLCNSGDHVVASRALFGSNYQVITGILPRFGIGYSLVDGNDAAAWRAAMTAKTKCVFIETPSNPLLEVVDIAMVAEIAHGAGARLIVDNQNAEIL